MLTGIEDKKKELARFIQIKCKDCKFKHSFYTSPQIDSTKDNRSRGKKTMEINVRAVYGSLSIAVIHNSLIKLCGFLNMPPPISKNAYDGLSYSIKVSSKQVPEKSISDSTVRLCGTD